MTNSDHRGSLIDGQSVKDSLRNSVRRRVIQVATDKESVIVLCNDGSLWSLLEHDEWWRLPPIPQEE